MAETTGYFEAAYVVAGVLYAAYVVSLFARRRAARARLARIGAGGGDTPSSHGTTG